MGCCGERANKHVKFYVAKSDTFSQKSIAFGHIVYGKLEGKNHHGTEQP